MYAIVTNNEITKLITNPKSLVIGDVRYPAKIFSVWSASELNAIGIYEVITDSLKKEILCHGCIDQDIEYIKNYNDNVKVDKLSEIKELMNKNKGKDLSEIL